MDIEIIEDLEAMERHKAEWDELFQASSHRSLHGEPDFCLNWIKAFGTLKASSPHDASTEKARGWPAKPILALLRDKGRLEVAMPLRLVPSRAQYMTPNPFPDIVRFLPTQSLQGLLNSHSRFTNISIREGSEAFAINAIPAAIAPLSWQSINLGLTPRDSVLSQTLEAALRPVARKVPAPDGADSKIAFTGTFQDLLEREPALQKNIERCRRRLERDFGPISFSWWRGEDALSKGFPAFLEVDAESWKASSPTGEALHNTATVKDYYHGLTQRLAKSGQAHAWALHLGDEIAAANLCFASRGVLHGYKTSYKEKFAPKAACRPGFVLLAGVVEQAWPEFDALSAMGGVNDYQFQPYAEVFEQSTFVANRPWRRLMPG